MKFTRKGAVPDRITSKPAAHCKLEISKYSWTFSPLPPCVCVCVCVCVCIVTQLCLTLCDPMACSPPGSFVHGDFSRQEYWSELSCPPPGDIPNPGIEPRAPSLQADSLPSESLGKPPLSLTQNKTSLWSLEMTLQRSLDFYSRSLPSVGPYARIQGPGGYMSRKKPDNGLP